MKYKTGDRVRLVNEAMEGIISKIFSDSEIELRDVNGFTYRLHISEIVHAATNYNLNEINSVENALTDVKSYSIGKYFSNFHSCFLCIVPENFDALLHSSYSVILVNASEKTLLYSLHQLVETNEGLSFGSVTPSEETVAVTVTLIEKQTTYRLRLKYIFHSPENQIGKREFSFTPEDFLDEELFLSRDLFRKHILAFDILSKDEMEIPEGEITKLIDYFSPKQKVIPKKEPPAKRRSNETALLTNEKTVDLHIEELTDEYSGMTNSDMINLQLTHFRRELDQAMLQHYYRIIFIHGKGNGFLKNKIRFELDAMNLKYHDADTGKFGFGATEVLL